MEWYLKIIGFLLGAGFGSAANALIDRLPREESWIRGRSKCDNCSHLLGTTDLIPLISFLLLRGRCRYCHKKISFRNFWVELMMAVIFSMIMGVGSPTPIMWILLGLVWVSVIIFVMDFETMLVSEVMVLAWLILAVAYQFVSGNFDPASSLPGILLTVGLIGGIWAISRGRAMGFGDVEIAAVIGWWLGWPNSIVALWTAFVAGAIVGGVQILRNKSHLKSQIPFGPFLILGSWVGILWGDKIIGAIFL